VASADAPLAVSVQRRLSAHGYSAAVAHSGDGCLRVATSLGPDLVLLGWRRALSACSAPTPAAAERA
jgi:hypothetical protein